MNVSVQQATLQEVLPWRGLYRHEMRCQLVCDSFHQQTGWTDQYWLRVGHNRVGYGAVVLGGPWKDNPALFEFYVLPMHRSHMFSLFEELLAATRVKEIYGQSNDSLLTPMLHAFSAKVESEAILYHDRTASSLAPSGALFRSVTDADTAQSTPERTISTGEWLVEYDGAIAGTGGILFHYNRPYGDIYVGVLEAYRRRGLGSFLVQELKRMCYEQGSIPAARRDTNNIASRKTLQKAGFVPCGHRLRGTV
jgi:GNAT superfamily N-acetyltransferase